MMQQENDLPYLCPAMKMIARFFLFAIIFPVFASAQTSSINGTVSQAEKPLEFVSVLLYRDSSQRIASAYTDSTGQFRLNNLVPGNYTLRLQLVGYQTKNIPVQIKNGTNAIGVISLNTDASQLKSVEVNSVRRIIKKTPNGFIINAKDNITQIGGTATDLLSNTPTVVTDPENGITIRGKTPLILINGRNSNIRSIDNIPASSIESIEIINNPSAQYDAESEGGIINITLKKNTGKGTNGSFVLGTGVGAKGRLNSAVLLGHQEGKWNIGLNYDNRFAGRTRHADAERINYFLPDNYKQTQYRNDQRYEETHNGKLNIDFTPDKRHTIGLEINGNIDNQHNKETLVTNISRSNKSFAGANSRLSDELEKGKEMEFALNYDQKFSNPKKKLSIILTSGLNWDRQNTDIPTTPLDSNGIQNGAIYMQRTHNYENAGVSNARIDYTVPVSATSVLAMGYKGTFRHIDADFVSEYLQGGSYILNPKASNHFLFNEEIQAGYMQYKGSIEQTASTSWKYDIGLRAEQTHNTGKDAGGKQLFSNSYLKLFPSATLSYYMSSSDFIKLGYYRRINRPGLGQLNPFIDITDSLNPHGGNPYLQPEIVNAFETGITKEWKKTSITFNVFYRHAVNSIRTLITLSNNGVALVLPQNIGTNDTYGVETIGSFEPFSFWAMNASVSLFRQQFNAGNVATGVSNSAVSGYGKLINNFSLAKNSKLQVAYNYTAPSVTPQGKRIAVYNADLGFQQKISKGRGALGLVITDIFNTQKNGFTASGTDFDYHRFFKVDTRAILVSFAWSFRTKLKEELLENKFSNE
jgi:outer membrane receptor protein involved in Fe transport